jgi:SAM-dependent methyltransferase
VSDAWADGSAYEAYMGRWSRTMASRFVEWLSPARGLRWMDVGCGTGALTEAILVRAEPASVIGIEPSAAFVSWLEGHIGDAPATFAVGDAVSLPRADVDVVVSGLMLNFVADPGAALRSMVEALSPSGAGVVAAYVWDYGEGMAMLRRFWDTAVALDPDAATLDEARRFPLCAPDALSEVWTDAGLVDVAVDALEVETTFAGFDDYWQPFLGATGNAT